MAAPHHQDRDAEDSDDDDNTQQHLVNQVLKTLWPGHKSCRYSACPNGMVEVDCPDSATVLPVNAVTKLHQAGLQPIVYLSRGCVDVGAGNAGNAGDAGNAQGRDAAGGDRRSGCW